jgi:hypothetical protein
MNPLHTSRRASGTSPSEEKETNTALDSKNIASGSTTISPDVHICAKFRIIWVTEVGRLVVRCTFFRTTARPEKQKLDRAANTKLNIEKLVVE